MDAGAFLEFLFKLELAVAASRGGDKDAVAYWLDASIASGDAFPLGSAQSQALGVLLDAVGPMAKGAAA